MKSLDRAATLLRVTVLVALASALPATSALAGCPPTPGAPELCEPLGQTSLAIDADGRFEWRASRGPADSAAQFVDPAGDYKLCVWDEEHLVVAADMPPNTECDGSSCWSASAPRYRDEFGTNGDIHLLDFSRSNSDETRLHALTMVVGGIILPVNGGAIVQLFRTDTAACLESFVPADAFTRDDKFAVAARFTAPSDSASTGRDDAAN